VSNLVSLDTHAEYRIDTISLACGKVASARARLGISREDFAEELANLLRWAPSAKTIEQWEKGTAPPPGDVIIASEMLAARAETRPARSLWRPDGIRTAAQLTPDDAGRLEAIECRPARLDRAAVESLAQVLSGQRHLEDSLGPSAILPPAEAQLNVIAKMLREGGSSPHRAALAHVVAEWISYAGWLRTAIRDDSRALKLFKDARKLADEIGNGTIAAMATSFIGYLARLEGRPRSVIRASKAALDTPGAHPTQRTFDMLQTAQGYADLGDTIEARRFLDRAADLASTAGDPPPQVYWYTEPFFRLNIGMALLSIGDYQDAADSLRSGLEDLPVDQRDAEWLNEYRQALVYANVRA
jgi:tetratricopeptide (TPR) repeat protein